MSKFDDLDEELELLGYGNQWDAISEKSASYKVIKNVNDIEKIKEHNRRYPEQHKAAMKRWFKRRAEEVKDRVGKENCKKCNAILMMADLITSVRNPGICKKCRKEINND